MLGSDVLEITIGMVFLFLFMSTIASALREVVEIRMQCRAADLEKGITEMLRTGQSIEWVEKLYNHPLILSLYKGERYVAKSKILPAYIPKENFSLALLDLAGKASQTGDILSVANLSQTLKADGQPNAVQRVVLNALAAGGNDIGEVRKHLERWYDATMERVSSWYARRTALILFLIGLTAAVFLNVDAITITKRLAVDRPLRQAIVAEAASYVKREAAGQPDAKKQPANGAPSQPSSPDSAATQADNPSPRTKNFQELQSEFQELGFPIGWMWFESWPYPAPQAKALEAAGYKLPYGRLSYALAMIEAFVGWLITAVAVMLGAPFWFDLLNKLVSLRSALKPQEKARAG